MGEMVKELEMSLYRDIIFMVAVIIFTGALWLNIDLTPFKLEAEKYANYNYIAYEMLNDATNTLSVASDKEALRSIETQDILVYNYSNTEDDYSVVLKVGKSENFSSENIKININYDIKYLNAFDYYEDNNYYYYVLERAFLVADSRKYVISMWYDESALKCEAFDYEYSVL